MPKPFIKDNDTIVISKSDETDPAIKPDDQIGDLTPSAEIKKSSEVSSSPAHTISANEDIEELKIKLQAKARNEKHLGNIAKTTAASLVNQAVSGDTDAINTIEDDPNLNDYIKKKFPEKYSDIFDKREEIPEFNPIKFKKEIKEDLKRESQEEIIDQKLMKSGIKGKENYDKIKGFATSLIENGANIDEAVSGALATSKSPATQPTVPNGVRNSMDTDDIVLSKSKILKLGLDPKLVAKQAKEGKLSKTTLNVITKR